jgi:proteic killer suppression protein
VIESFRDRRTKDLFEGTAIDRRWRRIATRALAKLQMLNAAETLYDLYVPPPNPLERLSGDRAGQYSIRIDERWRICFRFEDGNAHEVEIVDYH